MTSEERKAVVAEAMSWRGTVYHHNAAVKGAGADCAMFPLAVYRSLGLLHEVLIPGYDPQWGLHRDEEKYLDTIVTLGGIPTHETLPGNFIVWKFGRTFSHGGIILDWPQFIHASMKDGVQVSDAVTDKSLANREHRIFTL